MLHTDRFLFENKKALGIDKSLNLSHLDRDLNRIDLFIVKVAHKTFTNRAILINL